MEEQKERNDTTRSAECTPGRLLGTITWDEPKPRISTQPGSSTDSPEEPDLLHPSHPDAQPVQPKDGAAIDPPAGSPSTKTRIPEEDPESKPSVSHEVQTSPSAGDPQTHSGDHVSEAPIQEKKRWLPRAIPAFLQRSESKAAVQETAAPEKESALSPYAETASERESAAAPSSVALQTIGAEPGKASKEPSIHPVPASFWPTEGPRKGLVLGGGGAKGCYHVGAWQAFEEHGIHFDAVSGTSIGALVGSFYVQQNIEAVTDFVMGMTPTEIARELPRLPMTIKETVKGSKTILEFIMKYKDDKMDITPLKHHFDTLFHYDCFTASPIGYACMTFNDTRQEPRGFLKEEITAENAQDILMASAACYPAFPKVEMDGEIYMDGGYADNVPIELLHQAAPEIPDEHITVIDIHGPNDPVPPALTPQMRYIQPLLDPGNSIDFSSEHAIRLYNQGYLETLKYLDEYPGYLYTFLKEDASLIQVMEQYLDSQMEMHQIVLPDAGHIADHALTFALGYTPFALNNAFSQSYEYGKLIEALALMARVEPVALYDYRSFLKQVVENLGVLSLTNVPSNEFKMLEMFSNLKRDELTVQLHKLLVNGQGKLPSAIERMKDRIATPYTLAYIWYFAEELVKNLS